MAISWQLRSSCGCYRVYMAVTGSMSSFPLQKSPCVACMGQIYIKVVTVAFTVWKRKEKKQDKRSGFSYLTLFWWEHRHQIYHMDCIPTENENNNCVTFPSVLLILIPWKTSEELGGGGGGSHHITGYLPLSPQKASKGCVFQTYGIINIFLFLKGCFFFHFPSHFRGTT